MVKRIETIADLVMWLDCLPYFKFGKDSSFSGLPPDVRKELVRLIPKFTKPFKQCFKCNQIYPEIEEYYEWTQQGRTGYHSCCRVCRGTFPPEQVIQGEKKKKERKKEES